MKLDEKSSISIRLTIIIIALASWVVRLDDRVGFNEKAIEKLRNKIKEFESRKINDRPRRKQVYRNDY